MISCCVANFTRSALTTASGAPETNFWLESFFSIEAANALAFSISFSKRAISAAGKNVIQGVPRTARAGRPHGVTPTSGLSLTLFRGKAAFACNCDKDVVPQHQCVTRSDVINFPDLVAIKTVIVTTFVRRRCHAAFRVSIVQACIETPFELRNPITDPQRIVLVLQDLYMKVNLRFFRKIRPV